MIVKKGKIWLNIHTPEWRNWQTHTTQNRAGQPMRVRFSPPAFISKNMFSYRLLFPKESYPENWDNLRKAIYRRDKWRCQKCGIKNVQLHAHHQVPLSMGGSNDMENLTTLCRDCHIDNHPHMWWERWIENNPQALIAFRIIAVAIVIAILILSGFSWWKIIVSIIIFSFLF